MADNVCSPVLYPAVQAFLSAGRPEGRYGYAVPARRLAHAVGCGQRPVDAAVRAAVRITKPESSPVWAALFFVLAILFPFVKNFI